MSRLFEQYKKRNTVSLNGFWQFCTDEESKGEKEKWFLNFPEKGEKMYVPSCFNNSFGLLEYKGIVWYNREITISSTEALLEFEGVLGACKVWLDGELLGCHYGGYTTVSFYLSNIEKGKHSLTVLADNSSSSETIPSDVADWFSYGGISRNVNLYELNSTFISDLKINYSLNDNMTCADISVKANIKSIKDFKEKGEAKVYFEDEAVSVIPYERNGETQEITFNFKKDIELWDIDNPKLYYIRIEAEDDDITERIGFRKIEVQGKKILLNGRKIFLKGVNRHEDYPDFGHTFPISLMQRDIDIIKNLGCNTIRGSHYPNTHEFLDLLDEQGILFWSEIPMWGYQTEEELKSEVLQSRAIDMHIEMINEYYNHTSIVIWGMFNEIDSKLPIAYDIAERIFTLIRSMDSSRLITFATDRAEFDICFKFCDFIGINKYFGWYGGGTDAWKGFFETLKVWFEEQGVNDKPVVMSEFGGAALYGNHTFDNIKWSEEYQAQLLTESIEAFLESGMVTGTYVWHFADARTVRPSTDRARGFNNKGILNEYRKPKAAYFAVKKMYENIK